jgi:hypothetical protein
MTSYTNSSPWALTGQNSLYLNLLEIRPVPAESDDYRYVIENQYRHRPDLLAYDLYGDSRLWWVFAQRNPNTLKDPLYDFITGKSIFIPTLDNIKASLGI